MILSTQMKIFIAEIISLVYSAFFPVTLAFLNLGFYCDIVRFYHIVIFFSSNILLLFYCQSAANFFKMFEIVFQKLVRLLFLMVNKSFKNSKLGNIFAKKDYGSQLFDIKWGRIEKNAFYFLVKNKKTIPRKTIKENLLKKTYFSKVLF